LHVFALTRNVQQVLWVWGELVF